MDSHFPLYLIPLLPLLAAGVNLLLGRKLHRDTVGLIACLAVGASAVLAIWCVVNGVGALWYGDHQGPSTIRDTFYTWIQTADGFKVDIAFLLDPLSSVMVLIVTVIGFFIHVYAVGYMSHERDVARFFGYFNLFLGAMLVLVLGDSLPVMFIGWEGVGVSSFLLIGFWYQSTKNADAGRKAMVVNRIGDFAFLLGIFLTWVILKDLHFSTINAAAQQGGLLNLNAPRGWLNMPWAFWIGLLFFIGACGKSAQIPLYVWLPDAMAGPTPVSALMHAATMVTAGVYMMCRLHWLVLQSPTLMGIIAIVGAATAFFAATMAFAQDDIKRVLAYSTVSQLGYMVLAVGCGAFGAAIFHLLTHAFFKGLLFLGAGAVMHAMGNSADMRGMGGLRKKMPITAYTFLIASLAISGIVPFAGFFSKDAILGAAFTAGTRVAGWAPVFGYALYSVGLVTAALTAFYIFRAYFLTFEGEPRDPHAHPHEAPSSMTIPMGFLAIGATVSGAVLGWPSLRFNAMYNWFHGTFGEWYAITSAHPTYVDSFGREVLLMALALALAGGAIYAAWRAYGRGIPAVDSPVGRFVAAFPRFYRTVKNKYYVDEAYDHTFGAAFRGGTRGMRLFDRFAIDAVGVNGTAYSVGLVGRALRLIQNGDVQRYLAAVVIGAAGILWFASRPPTTFTAQPDHFAPLVLHFDASAAASGVARDLRYEWDFGDHCATDAECTNGETCQPDLQECGMKCSRDSQCRAGDLCGEDGVCVVGGLGPAGQEVTHTYRKPGDYTVRVHVTDLKWDRTAEAALKIQAFDPAPGPVGLESEGR